MPNLRTEIPSRRRSSVRLLFTAIGIGLAVLGIIAVSSLTMGRISGEEFAADSFRRRSFRYLQLPLLQIQISPIVRADATNPLEAFLRTASLIPKSAAAESTGGWHLVRAENGGRVYSRGEAEILCNYLDAVDDQGNHVWLNWTREHPEQAAVFWPVVARLARRDLYVFIPDLFRAARATTGTNELKVALDQLVAEHFYRTALNLIDLDQADAAARFLDEALDLDPAHEGSRREKAQLRGNAVQADPAAHSAP